MHGNTEAELSGDGQNSTKKDKENQKEFELVQRSASVTSFAKDMILLLTRISLLWRNSHLNSQWFETRSASMEPHAARLGAAHSHKIPAGISLWRIGPLQSCSLPQLRKTCTQTSAGLSLAVKEMPTARAEGWRAVQGLHNLSSAYRALTGLSYFQ